MENCFNAGSRVTSRPIGRFKVRLGFRGRNEVLRHGCVILVGICGLIEFLAAQQRRTVAVSTRFLLCSDARAAGGSCLSDLEVKPPRSGKAERPHVAIAV